MPGNEVTIASPLDVLPEPLGVAHGERSHLASVHLHHLRFLQGGSDATSQIPIFRYDAHFSFHVVGIHGFVAGAITLVPSNLVNRDISNLLELICMRIAVLSRFSAIQAPNIHLNAVGMVFCCRQFHQMNWLSPFLRG